MPTRRPLPRLYSLDELDREAILRTASDTCEPRVLRAIARSLRVTLPEIAAATRCEFWAVERTLNGRRPADAGLLAAVRDVLGVTRADVAACLSGELRGGAGD